LCDTNGGALPAEIADVINAVKQVTDVPIGIHAHNDSELAVANTLAAVNVGVSQVQGTINGYGERCGNANLCSIIPALKIKMGIDCVTDEQLAKLAEVAHYVSEVANLVLDAFLPYIGASAFSHKGGLHVSGLRKWSGSYQHIDPELVGNKPRMLISELSGRASIVHRARELGVDLPLKSKEAQELLDKVKMLESRGFQYENAEASFDLLVQRAKADYKKLFELVDFMVIVEKRRRPPSMKNAEEMMSEAIVKVRVDNEVMHTAAEGNGPVNALDKALRKALLGFYPSLSVVKLIDYKVRILEGSTGTESQVRVIIESSDGTEQWRTVGSSTNIIEASWLALADSLEHWLLKQKAR
jgi:2-isopropylmalate synthase